MFDENMKLGKIDTHGINIELYLEIGSTTPKEIWENKDIFFEQTKKSQDMWDKMNDDNKEVLISLVTGALERMHDRVDEWVPEGLVAKGGEYLDINIRILFTDIDKAIDRNEQATSFQIKAAEEETASWLI